MSTTINQTELSGMLGEIVSVRKVSNRLVVTNRPKRTMGKPTDKQETVRRKFRAAAQYANKQIAQPEFLALYAAGINDKKKSAHMVAMNDYLVVPKVESIDTQGYRGNVGNGIVAIATDDFMVTKVSVTISNAAGAIIEEGEAAKDENLSDQWEYKATTANPALTGTKIQVVAYDRPGNKGSKEVVL